MARTSPRLLAIEHPAPSIPARFRLYHGGQAKRGYLVTHDPESGGYLGDYVYFSSLRSYAEGYVRRSSDSARTLFVIDARYVPAGTRVMMSDEKGWPPRGVEGLLFALIDMTHDLKDLASTRTRSAALSPEPVPDVPSFDAAIASRIQGIRYLRRASENVADGPALSPRLHRLLRTALARFLDPAIASATAELVPSDDYPSKDRWNDAILFLLDTFGTLDLTVEQLNIGLDRYREEWQQTFTRPLSHANLEAARQLGLDAIRSDDYGGGARSGMIITVPGPIPVLPARRTAGRRPKSVSRRKYGE
jgi:hypothetical protein